VVAAVPSNPAAQRLTEAARQEQVNIRAGFLAEFLALWGLLDPLNLDRTTPGWVRAVIALVELWRGISANAADDYYRDFRQLEIPGASPLPPITFIDTPSAERAARREARRAAPSVNRGPAVPRRDGLVRTPQQSGLIRRSDEQAARVIDWGARRGAVQASLEVTGPINLKVKTARGKTPQQAAREALVDAAGAAARHVQDGDRTASIVNMRNDSLLKGWVRVTDSNPCSFCAMLASRGPVFRSQSFTNARSRRNPRNPGVEFLGAGSFKVHDHCACRMAPVYYTDAEWPGNARELNDLWQANIAKRYSGHEALKAWRRLYERRQRELGLPPVGFPQAA
jgi:hypothetical protein